MKKVALALAVVLGGSSLAIGLASTDANAGIRNSCKQGFVAHPGNRYLMKRCKAEYRAYKKARSARASS